MFQAGGQGGDGAGRTEQAHSVPYIVGQSDPPHLRLAR